jgi:hypothetical protein
MHMTTKTSLRALALCLALLAAPAFSATYWVGSSAACSGSNVHPSLGAALLAAAFNGAQSDEIRLTNTISYAGSAGKVTLTDWSSASAGNLTIAGGYANCFTSPSGRTNFGNTTGASITVQTSSQSESVVTLRRLNIRAAETGIVVNAGAEVYLENTRVGDHVIRGVLIPGGGYVSIDASSIVELNGDSTPGGDTWGGGGVYCNGTGSEVTLSGRLHANSGEHGGNAYLSNGCMMFALGGAVIDANKVFGPGFAQLGGGVYVDSGGQLFSNGGSGIVLFRENYAAWGGGLYVKDTGKATLVNTRFVSNGASYGAAIYAVDGGTSGSTQVSMDRGSSCPFTISCSELEGNVTERSVIHVDNSRVQINRTIIELSSLWVSGSVKSLIYGTNGAQIRLGHVGLYRNTTDHALWNDGATFEVQHATIARNEKYVSGGSNTPAGALLAQNGGNNFLHNSIIADSTGVDLQSGSLNTPCLLLDGAAGDLTPGMYHAGTPQFINAGSGDFRQASASPGVDMCMPNPLLWSSDEDIERQVTGVNDANNDQGNPGDSGGYYDAGFDENHMNVGPDYFTLTAATSGNGTVVSVPLGIACGSDCQEDFFNGTLVELHANASGTSVFDGWTGCPLPSGNVCNIAVTEDTTVTASFTVAGDEIFSDRFQSAP